jgi:hypothetical protein
MTVNFDLMDEGRILLVTFGADFSLREQADDVTHQVQHYLDSAQEPLSVIEDLREIKLDLAEIAALSTQLRGKKGAAQKHPNLRHMVYITTSQLCQPESQAVRDASRIPDVFCSLEGALSAVTNHMSVPSL